MHRPRLASRSVSTSTGDGVGDGGMVEPVSPSVVTESVNPSVVTAPVNPSIVTAPVNPSVVAESVNPSVATAPVNPSVITAPVSPSVVTESVNPSVVAESVNPSVVAESVNPSVVTAPVNPSIVAESVNRSVVTPSADVPPTSPTPCSRCRQPVAILLCKVCTLPFCHPCFLAAHAIQGRGHAILMLDPNGTRLDPLMMDGDMEGDGDVRDLNGVDVSQPTSQSISQSTSQSTPQSTLQSIPQSTESLSSTMYQITTYKPCSIHPTLSLDTYCILCRCIICTICASINHIYHPSQPLQLAFLSHQQSLQAILKSLQYREQQLLASIQAVVPVITQIEEEAEWLVNDTLSKTEQLLTILSEREERVMESLAEETQARRTKLELQLTNLEGNENDFARQIKLGEEFVGSADARYLMDKDPRPLIAMMDDAARTTLKLITYAPSRLDIHMDLNPAVVAVQGLALKSDSMELEGGMGGMARTEETKNSSSMTVSMSSAIIGVVTGTEEAVTPSSTSSTSSSTIPLPLPFILHPSHASSPVGEAVIKTPIVMDREVMDGMPGSGGSGGGDGRGSGGSGGCDGSGSGGSGGESGLVNDEIGGESDQQASAPPPPACCVV